MANTFKTTTWMAKEFLRHFENNNTFSKFVTKGYGAEYMKPDMRPGTTIKIPKPPRFAVTSGATATFPDLTEDETSLTIGQYHTSFAPTGLELATSVDKAQWSERYIKPQAIALASQVDKDGLDLVRTTVANATGTPGTTPTALLDYSTARAIAAEHGMPVKGDISIVLNPVAEATIVDAAKALFNASSEIERQYKEGTMGYAYGAKWSMDQLVASHTGGQLGGTPLVNGAVSTGTSVVTDAWTAGAANRLKAGDIVTFGNTAAAKVFAVNPITKQSTGRLQQFVVTADAASDGSGNLTMSVLPSIVSSGTMQNVSQAIPDNATVNVMHSASAVYTHNVLFHKDAFGLASIPVVPLGGGVEASVMTDPDTGITVCVSIGADVTNFKRLVRCDVLYGWAALRPEWACRIHG